MTRESLPFGAEWPVRRFKGSVAVFPRRVVLYTLQEETTRTEPLKAVFEERKFSTVEEKIVKTFAWDGLGLRGAVRNFTKRPVRRFKGSVAAFPRRVVFRHSREKRRAQRL